MNRKIKLIVIITSACFILASCNNNDTSVTSDENTVTTADSSQNDVVEQAKIENSFPDFLKKAENINKLSNVAQSSFDYNSSNADVAEQPFQNFYCKTSFLSGSYYSYKINGKTGLLNSKGKIILEPKYYDITLVRNDVFRLGTLDSYLYAKINKNGNLSIIKTKNPWFAGAKNISASKDPNTVYFNLKTADGSAVFDEKLTSVEKLSLKSYQFDQDVLQAYKVTKGSEYYIITFDYYSNYRVYEGCYGTIEISLGDQKGSCYILSHKDYIMLQSLIRNFGTKSSTHVKSTGKTYDYIKITFNSPKIVYTYLSNGIGMSEITSTNSNENNISYSVYDEVVFSDLIKFVNFDISAEYE